MGSNRHKYVIWWSDEDYAKLRWQTQSAIMKVLLDDYGDTPTLDKALPKIMDKIEKSWKKIRGRDIPIV
jgi:hypothetical protein